MPLLAYCVALPGEAPSLSVELPSGIETLEAEGLRCYYSLIKEFGSDPQQTAAAALRFHQTNTALFQAATILPFRFPTVLTSLDDLTSRVTGEAERLRSALERLRDRVQMEITISLQQQSDTAQSGTEYLRSIQQRERQLSQAGEALRQAGRLALEWKQQSRDRQLRILALVERGSQQAFSQDLASVSLPHGVECRVVGPWPPSEFIDR
jgi:hypothetical protein